MRLIKTGHVPRQTLLYEPQLYRRCLPGSYVVPFCNGASRIKLTLETINSGDL